MPEGRQTVATTPGRPTLVLLHGVGGSAAGFARLAAEFDRLGWPAVAWSQPGYDGTPLVEPYDLGNCARALAAWLAGRRQGPVVLVGHSMGGMLAQTLSAQTTDAQTSAAQPPAAGSDSESRSQNQSRSESEKDRGGRAGSDADADIESLAGFRIVGLVLAHTSPAFGNAGGDFQRRFVTSRTAPLDQGKTMRDIAATLVPGMTAPQASPEAREAAIAMMAGVPAGTYRLAVAAIAGFEGRGHLPEIRVPTLCLAAEHDATSAPAVLQRMAERIPGADYHCLEGLGHLAPIEDPRRWAATVADWCARRIANDPESGSESSRPSGSCE